MHDNLPHMVLDRVAPATLPGDIVEGAAVQRLLVAGAALIPVEPALLLLNAAGGFAQRWFGRLAPVPEVVPGVVARLLVYLVPERNRLHWRAKLQFDAAALKRRVEGQPFDGVLRLTPDSSQSPAQGGGLQATGETHVELMGVEPDADGCAVVGGSAGCGSVGGFHGLALHGAGRGVRVLWFAASQTT